MATIYIYLMDEGVDVWRPVPATQVRHDIYRIELPEWYDPGDEEWEFKPGALVRVKERQFSNAETTDLVAFEAVETIDPA